MASTRISDIARDFTVEMPKIGWVVKLNSSAQLMTVEATTHALAKCVWICDITGTFHRQEFRPEVLTVISKEL
jgi:hypothetical protein